MVNGSIYCKLLPSSDGFCGVQSESPSYTDISGSHPVLARGCWAFELVSCSLTGLALLRDPLYRGPYLMQGEVVGLELLDGEEAMEECQVII
jgi:hypothetical protein